MKCISFGISYDRMVSLVYYVEREGKVTPVSEYREEQKSREHSVIGLFTFEEMEETATRFQINYALLLEYWQSRTTKYENFDGFDLICVNILDYQHIEGRQGRALIYLDKKHMLFFGDHIADTQKLLDAVYHNGRENYSKSHALHDFFCYITVGDREYFDAVEKEILDLEQALITSEKRDCVKEIISLRKRLMTLKKYYEQWIDVLDNISENENGLIDHKTLRYFKILGNRIERLYQNVLNLRDYVTQVRESYQAQVDINLNETMKIFTVITTIFLPLTLIVGWYGMNFQMPEYGWKYGYGMVIGASLLTIVGVFIYFKKMRWF